MIMHTIAFQSALANARSIQSPYAFSPWNNVSKLSSVDVRARLLPARIPPQIPPCHSSRRRQRVAAWLTGHNDAAVLASASAASSSAPATVYGSVSNAISSARCSSVQQVFAHRHALTPSVLNAFTAAGLVPVLVSSKEREVVRRTGTNASPAAYIPVMCTAATGAPLLIETKSKVITRFFEPEEDPKGPLVREEQIDERSFIEKIIAWLTRVYLPQGFPHTTTPDYISFTKFRTLQNLASAIMQVISTEALLFGLGLGKKVAAGAAATSWVLKDGASYLVKIGYGSIFGSKFDDDPKSWRIAADIVEDVGGAIEILTPLFPLTYFLPLASLAVCLRGMSLMTGTATRHVVYRSLAASGMQNTGDIATKGESQGVTMKMIGLGTGIVVSSSIGQNYYALLAAYTVLAGVHIAANWKSVQCVQFSFLNKQRASILIENHLNGKHIPTPYEVSHFESIILPPWRGFEPSVKIGVGLKEIKATTPDLKRAIRMFRREKFLVVTPDNSAKIFVLLRSNASSEDSLRAYYTVKKFIRSSEKSQGELLESYRFMKTNIRSFQRESIHAGWDNGHMLLSDGQVRVSW